jgi:hypothetical protein
LVKYDTKLVTKAQYRNRNEKAHAKLGLLTDKPESEANFPNDPEYCELNDADRTFVPMVQEEMNDLTRDLDLSQGIR